jgi:hypothetical protein
VQGEVTKAWALPGALAGAAGAGAGAAPAAGAAAAVIRCRRRRSSSTGRKSDPIKLSRGLCSSLDSWILEVSVLRAGGADAQTEEGGDVAVWGGGAEAAAAVAGLGDGGACALAGVECAATLLAVGVLGAGGGD